MDRLGIAQYLTRIALALEGGQQMLDRIKVAWLDHPDWQPMRHLMEDAMVTKDWFELHLIQNFLLDGAVFPFAYVHVDQLISAQAGIGYGLATEFMRDWYAESIRWTDAALKVVVKFSDENRALLNSWVMAWEPRVREALAPLANAAFGANAAAITEAIFAELSARRVKLGLAE